MNIVICEKLDPVETQVLSALQRSDRVRFVDEPLTAENAAQFSDVDVVSAGLQSALTAELLRRLEHVRLIAIRATGVDSIDVGYCEAHGIAVANVPSYGAQSVAEHTFALLLAISHRVVDAAERTRRGEFSQVGLRGFDLAGKTLGVIGAGQIGLAVIRMAKGFGMNVIAFEPHPDAARARELDFAFTGFDDLLRRSDIVTLHVPLNAHTQNLIGRAQLAMMKLGAVLINTARGPLVDTPALVEALKDGRLRAAGLDVLPDEAALRDEGELLREAFDEEHDTTTLLANELLLRLPNALVTPHNAGNTVEALTRIATTTVNNILAFARSSSAS